MHRIAAYIYFMKRIVLLSFAFFLSFQLTAQKRIYPIIEDYGGIFDAPNATEKPDPNMEYKVVIDVATGDSEKSDPFYSLVNVARLLNLHAMGGVSKENMKVVLAIHSGAVWSVLNNERYRERFEVDNPHLLLFQELQEAGVKIFVCSQSLMAREIDHQQLASGLGVTTSMLTTMTTYQLKGYASLKF